MAFVWFPSPQFRVLHNGPMVTVTCQMGRDPMTLNTLHVEAVLSPFPQAVDITGSPASELIYYVVEVDAVSGAERSYFSGLQTQHIFGRPDRPAVMAHIGLCVSRALYVLAPLAIYRETYDKSPPPKALLKHQLIHTYLVANGYTVTTWQLPDKVVYWANL